MADNSSRKFKFISPGVFIDEIDQSQLPATPTEVGPLVMGRARRGPANKPVTINSYADFVQTFGDPVPGNQGGDIWREGNLTAPTYAAYAAKAWLRNNSPLSFMRVLGDQDSNATSDGKAGWKVSTFRGTDDNSGGVFALVVWPSASLDQDQTVRGAVAAQFYLTSGRLLLSASSVNQAKLGGGSKQRNGSTLCEVASKGDFTLQFRGATTGSEQNMTVSLDPTSPNFIRKALNTNPTITNTAITDESTRTFYQGGNYWLGETFEYALGLTGSASTGILEGTAGSSFTKLHAAIFPMRNNASSSIQQNDFEGAATKGTTGWYISQDLSTDNESYNAKAMQKLFRFEAITAGEFTQQEVKISISELKPAKGDYQSYGSFSVLVRRLTDTDNNMQILERYDLCDLNPASENYVAKKIGDKYEVYDATNKRNVLYGEFENRSNYIRVVMNDTVAAGAGETRWLPYGVHGPLQYRNAGIASGSLGFSNNLTLPTATARGSLATMLAGNDDANFGLSGHLGGTEEILYLDGYIPVSGNARVVQFPSVPLRSSSTWGSPRKLKSCFWGAWTGRSGTDTFFNPSIHDMVRARSFDSDDNSNPASTARDFQEKGRSTTTYPTTNQVISWVFSLDDVSGSAAAGYTYVSGSRRAGTSTTAASVASLGAGGYTGSLADGLDRFTTVLFGGTDGYDITEREPFRNSKFSTATDPKASYELYSLRKAIDIMSDPDYISLNAATIPGVWVPEVTNYLLDTVEERADALALVDIQYGYTPDTEDTGSAEDRNSANTPTAAADALADRSINNSYGATYYPWVRVMDTNANQTLWAPPSVAALGVLSNTDRQQAPWFAPAGFTRGGLSEGAAGIPVVDVSRRLTSDERDTLYEDNINPIAKFPAEGIVVFGQKTLQQTASALDRINVRRLLIYLKKEISFIASRLLFGPNTQDTWNRFLGQANPLLEGVKADFGIDEFRLILDDTTTTPDLIDRNIIYAKLYVKPTKSVEYFAIDFIVTNSGASFED